MSLSGPARVGLAALATGAGLVTTAGIGLYWFATRQPAQQDLALPPSAIALDSADGQRLLAAAIAADHNALGPLLQTQEKGTWCGVASATTAINALQDPDIRQDGLFTDEAGEVRSWWAVTFGGMPIADLAGLLEAHGRPSVAHYASDTGVDGFVAEARRNFADPSDVLIVNYDRKALGEVGGGHISPVSALSADGGHVLLLDTATYKYPPHWVPTDALFTAMNTPDSESGRSRGWVVVR